MGRALVTALLFLAAPAFAERLRLSFSDTPDVLYEGHDLQMSTSREVSGELLASARRGNAVARRISIPAGWVMPLAQILRSLDSVLAQSPDRLMAIPPDPDIYDPTDRSRRAVRRRNVLPGQVLRFDGHVRIGVERDAMTSVGILPADDGGGVQPLRPRRDGRVVLPAFLGTHSFLPGNEDYFLLSGHGVLTQLMVVGYDPRSRVVSAIFAEDFWQSFLLHPGEREALTELPTFRVPALGLMRWTAQDQEASIALGGTPFPFRRNLEPEVGNVMYPELLQPVAFLDYSRGPYYARFLDLLTFRGLLAEISRDCRRVLSELSLRRRDR